MASDERYIEDEVAEETGAAPTNPHDAVPPIVRTVAYIVGALGLALILADAQGVLDVIAKTALGFASAMGITYNPSFGVGAKK